MVKHINTLDPKFPKVNQLEENSVKIFQIYFGKFHRNFCDVWKLLETFWTKHFP